MSFVIHANPSLSGRDLVEDPALVLTLPVDDGECDHEISHHGIVEAASTLAQAKSKDSDFLNRNFRSQAAVIASL